MLGGRTEKIKCHADFFLLMPIALPVLYRADCDLEGDDVGCYGQLSTLRAATQRQMYRYISIRHLQEDPIKSRGQTQAEGPHPCMTGCAARANVRASVGGFPSALNPGRRPVGPIWLELFQPTHSSCLQLFKELIEIPAFVCKSFEGRCDNTL